LVVLAREENLHSFFAQKVFLSTNFSVFFSFEQICLKIRKLAPFLAK
jgi:hypothetical protein